MPALPNSASGSISKICPPLPPTASISSAPSIPGSFSPLPPTPKQFVFGTKRDAGITRTEFSAAAEEVLAQMNARLPSNASKLSHELLKGKKVEVGSLVSANREVGAPGWRLSASGSSSRNDRFAVAHEKEFAR
jgi:hypothetical protein